MMPVLTAIASSPWFPIILSVFGLAWIYWVNRPARQQPLETLPLKSSPPDDFLDPGEIIKNIKQAPLFKQSNIAKHYIGTKINCEGELRKYDEHGTIATIIVAKHGAIIKFTINQQDYSEIDFLKLIEQKTTIRVEGIIDRFDRRYARIILNPGKIIS